MVVVSVSLSTYLLLDGIGVVAVASSLLSMPSRLLLMLSLKLKALLFSLLLVLGNGCRGGGVGIRITAVSILLPLLEQVPILLFVCISQGCIWISCCSLSMKVLVSLGLLKLMCLISARATSWDRMIEHVIMSESSFLLLVSLDTYMHRLSDQEEQYFKNSVPEGLAITPELA